MKRSIIMISLILSFTCSNKYFYIEPESYSDLFNGIIPNTLTLQLLQKVNLIHWTTVFPINEEVKLSPSRLNRWFTEQPFADRLLYRSHF